MIKTDMSEQRTILDKNIKVYSKCITVALTKFLVK